MMLYNGVEFSVGDKVRVVRSVADDEREGAMGSLGDWHNEWDFADDDGPGMDAFIGNEYTIENCIVIEGNNLGVTFQEESGEYKYTFPLAALELIVEGG